MGYLIRLLVITTTKNKPPTVNPAGRVLSLLNLLSSSFNFAQVWASQRNIFQCLDFIIRAWCPVLDIIWSIKMNISNLAPIEAT